MNVNERLIKLGHWSKADWWNKERSDHDNRLHSALDELEHLRREKHRLESQVDYLNHKLKGKDE